MKTKALISFAATGKLIFALFSHMQNVGFLKKVGILLYVPLCIVLVVSTLKYGNQNSLYRTVKTLKVHQFIFPCDLFLHLFHHLSWVVNTALP